MLYQAQGDESLSLRLITPQQHPLGTPWPQKMIQKRESRKPTLLGFPPITLTTYGDNLSTSGNRGRFVAIVLTGTAVDANLPLVISLSNFLCVKGA